MSQLSEFCTCSDRKCPLHPANHNKGCSLCIAKNLKQREIPNCFFNLVDKDYNCGGYSFADFAKLVLGQKE